MKGQSENKIVVVQNIIDRVFNIILLSVSILFLCVGIYALIDNHLIVKEADIPDSLKRWLWLIEPTQIYKSCKRPTKT